MGAYRASTLIDFERGQPLELDALFLEPLAPGADVRAWQRRRLEALSRTVLSQLDGGRNTNSRPHSCQRLFQKSNFSPAPLAG